MRVGPEKLVSIENLLCKEKTNLSRANSMENILKSIKSGEKKLLNVVLD